MQHVGPLLGEASDEAKRIERAVQRPRGGEPSRRELDVSPIRKEDQRIVKRTGATAAHDVESQLPEVPDGSGQAGNDDHGMVESQGLPPRQDGT